MEGHVFSFEKLDAWQEARKLAREVYTVTASFPNDERFGLTSQIRTSAISICSNIAEGTTRSSAKDQAHFTTMSFGSLMELLNHLIIAADLKYLSEEKLSTIRQKIQPLSIKLSNLKKSQLSRLRGV
jgi:four helix bundle protein